MTCTHTLCNDTGTLTCRLCFGRTFSPPASESWSSPLVSRRAEDPTLLIPSSHRYPAGPRECFVPRYTADTMEMLRVDSLADIAALPKTKWNIAQPEGGWRSCALSALKLRRERPLTPLSALQCRRRRPPRECAQGWGWTRRYPHPGTGFFPGWRHCML